MNLFTTKQQDNAVKHKQESNIPTRCFICHLHVNNLVSEQIGHQVFKFRKNVDTLLPSPG